MVNALLLQRFEIAIAVPQEWSEFRAQNVFIGMRVGLGSCNCVDINKYVCDSPKSLNEHS